MKTFILVILIGTVACLLYGCAGTKAKSADEATLIDIPGVEWSWIDKKALHLVKSPDYVAILTQAGIDKDVWEESPITQESHCAEKLKISAVVDINERLNDVCAAKSGLVGGKKVELNNLMKEVQSVGAVNAPMLIATGISLQKHGCYSYSLFDWAGTAKKLKATYGKDVEEVVRKCISEGGPAQP